MQGFIMVGSPGAGKGTLGQYLKHQFRFKHVSSGDLLRREVQAKTAIGLEIKGLLAKGLPVPEEIVFHFVQHFLDRTIARKDSFSFDGYPQTLPQYKKIINYMHAHPFLSFVCIEVSFETALSRMVSRRTCVDCEHIYNLVTAPSKFESQCHACQGPLKMRESDTPSSAMQRLQFYEDHTSPVITMVKTAPNCIVIDGNQSIDQMRLQLLAHLKKHHEIETYS